jgi:hypothetical protein
MNGADGPDVVPPYRGGAAVTCAGRNVILSLSKDEPQR